MSSGPAPGFEQYPNHSVDIAPEPRLVVARVSGRELARSTAAFIVQESRYPPVWYLPREDVDTDCLSPSETTTYCPFKGTASYFHITAAGEQLADAVWSYETPFDECAPLAGYVSFYADRVDIQVG